MESSSGDKKTIQINPELFKVSGNTTRKQRKPRENKNPIKVRAPTKTPNTSTLKKNILKMIRNHQQKTTPKEQPTEGTGVPKSEFEQSMQFLDTIHEKKDKSNGDAKKEKRLRKAKNHTIRNVMPIQQASVYVPAHVPSKPNVVASMPPTIRLDTMPKPDNATPIVLAPPKYGCLKNGNLPTYRTWKNQTQRTSPMVPIPRPVEEVRPSASLEEYREQLTQKVHDLSKQEQLRDLRKPPIYSKPKKPRKQKRIMRRTFRVGKSKAFPKVSVLVANKTIRNNTNLKQIELQQTPIKDVKHYLLKQGLIKVGTTTPNDVLRQMFESARMLCGEVKNHNSENLLYNYFNADQD